VARAPVPKRLVAVGMKPLMVSEKRRALNISLPQWWDRKLELGPDDHLMSLAWWVASMERWQREQRELQERVFELEEEMARMKRKVKGKGKEKEDVE